MPSKTVSATALFIAQSQHLLGRRKRFQLLFDPEILEWYEAFLNAAGHRTVSYPIIDWQYIWARALERITIPGIYLHYCLRKQAIRTQVCNLLTEGKISQVVVLAAGLDPLCAILAPRFPKTNFWEIDLPATQHIKKIALARATHSNNLVLLPAVPGLACITEILESSAFSKQLPTLFLVEGISMYLSSNEVDALLRTLAGLANSAGALLLTFMERGENASIQFQNSSCLVKPWLRLKGEPFKWGIEREQLSSFLLERKWHLKELHDYTSFRDNYLNNSELQSEQLAKGECLALATKGG